LNRYAGAAWGALSAALIGLGGISFVAGTEGWSPEGNQGPNIGSAVFGLFYIGSWFALPLLMSGAAIGATIERLYENPVSARRPTGSERADGEGGGEPRVEE
jgi:hypothetical protein